MYLVFIQFLTEFLRPLTFPKGKEMKVYFVIHSKAFSTTSELMR